MARGSSSVGVRLDLSQKNVAGVIARIYSADTRCTAAMRRTARRAGAFCQELTQALAPKDTAFMAEHVRTEYTPEGFGFETGWLAQDYLDAGLPFYPPYQEFGTRFMPPQPSLYPAYKATQEFYLEEVRKNIRDAITRERSA
jgi:HK97 gp10 family phage protein